MHTINYAPLYAFALKHRLPYNDLCVAVREAVKPAQTTHLVKPEPVQVHWFVNSEEERNCKHEHTTRASGLYSCTTCKAVGLPKDQPVKPLSVGDVLWQAPTSLAQAQCEHRQVRMSAVGRYQCVTCYIQGVEVKESDVRHQNRRSSDQKG